MNKRSFLGLLAAAAAAAAALPLVSKLPAVLITPVKRVGAWAEAKIIAGQVVSVIISSGSGYSSSPTVTIVRHDDV